MCYSVLSEINQVKRCEEDRKCRLPRPYYLFVQRYGRSVEQEMPEIARLLGDGTWFFFSTEGKKKDVSITSRFLVEQEKYAGIGKMFQGCVLVELSGQEEPKELFEFLSYIQQKTQQFCCVFSTCAMDCAEKILDTLEQHFFVRMVEGEKFNSAEQKELFLGVLREFGFAPVERLEREVEQLFLDVYWEETDMVQNKIENLARNIVYEKLLGPETEQVITPEEVREAAAGLRRETEKMRRIGFVRGEWSYE